MAEIAKSMKPKKVTEVMSSKRLGSGISSGGLPAAGSPAIAEKSARVAETKLGSQVSVIAPESIRLEMLREFVGHTAQIRSVAFSADGKYALSGGVDHILRLWDVKTGNQVRYFQDNVSNVNFVGFSTDGGLVIL